MSYPKKQRTRIDDLLADENELFELSEQMMMMVGGGYECPEHHDKGDEYDFDLSLYENIDRSGATSAGSCTAPGASDDNPD